MADSEEKSNKLDSPVEDSGDKDTLEESKETARSIEAAEEAKLKARLPQGMMGRPAAGHSAFLQKRLGKGQKYFDSGDYQMALQKPNNKSRMPPLLAHSTGEAIPTPDTVPIRKTSIIQQPKLAPSTAS
ncbi:cAMP-regulated phosphoprotein 19 [Hyalella azteca]|uniref:cAMP-regulated phosphoprotein 19 n=1 Tax=Hyalella azteca TaxID=294128 RepID=A0A8B7N808_HYAAZ|nr:cAMP-regulated phosphoprotein 19 [Hyalella azteca]